MIVTIFRSRLRPEHGDEYGPMAESIHALAEKMPGFVSIRSYLAEDGERVSIVEFESWETHNAWRDHAKHRIAQQLGRDRFYSEYSIQVCTLERQSHFKMDPAEAGHRQDP
jgi:heme-degrading monooxygenase HmoA